MRVRRGSWQVRRSVRAVSDVVLWGACGAALLVFGACRGAWAENANTEPQYSWREMWVGADATKDVWLLYTGITLAPLSKDVYTDGLRLRMTSGYGQYTARHSQGTATKTCIDKNGVQHACNGGDSQAAGTDSKINITYSDALVGYHMQFGALTAKAFVGASMVSHHASASDASSPLLGTAIGATGALEFWLNASEDAWTSFDLNYTMAHDTASIRWRAGWRALPTLSVGPEVRFERNEQAGTARIGAFARYEWFGGEISAAAGVATDVCDFYNGEHCSSSFDELAPYANLNFLTQY